MGYNPTNKCFYGRKGRGLGKYVRLEIAKFDLVIGRNVLRPFRIRSDHYERVASFVPYYGDECIPMTICEDVKFNKT